MFSVSGVWTIMLVNYKYAVHLRLETTSNRVTFIRKYNALKAHFPIFYQCTTSCNLIYSLIATDVCTVCHYDRTNIYLRISKGYNQNFIIVSK